MRSGEQINAQHIMDFAFWLNKLIPLSIYKVSSLNASEQTLLGNITVNSILILVSIQYVYYLLSCHQTHKSVYQSKISYCIITVKFHCQTQCMYISVCRYPSSYKSKGRINYTNMVLYTF